MSLHRLPAAPADAQPQPPPPAKSAVAVAHDDSAIEQFEENPFVIRQMVDAVVRQVTGKGDTRAAWASLVKPGDKVGIKVATAGGRFFSTHRSVVAAIAAGLQSAGVPASLIIVWDRDAATLAAAGYTGSNNSYQVQAITPPGGYDPQVAVTSAVMGQLIWGDLGFSSKHDIKDLERARDDQLSDASHFPLVLTQEVTKVIDVPVLSDAGCGVGGCFYNMTVANIDNWRRFLQPPDFGDPYLAEIYADEHIAPKVVLHIMDGLIAQFAGGPEFQPNYAFRFATIYASKDPVAIDATALRLIEQWRAQAKLPALAGQGDFLKSAANAGLGNFAPEQIVLKQVER